MHAAANSSHPAIEAKTIFILPHSVRTVAVARACRAALVSFCNGAERWTKQDLACWLSGPYARITDASRALVEEMPAPPRPAVRRVDDRALAQVVREAVGSTRELLRASMYAEGSALTAWDAWRRGLVARCEDESNVEGWIPLDLPSMRLTDRLTSLWAADYLTEADEYEAFLSLCEVCHTVSFDPFLRAQGCCAAHAMRQIAVEWSDGEETVYASRLDDAPRSARADGHPASEPRTRVHRRVV